MKTLHFSEAYDNEMSALAALDKMTPDQEAMVTAWLSARIDITKESHQAFPGPPQGDDEIIQAREAYVKARMNCEPYYELHVPTASEREAMRRMRNRGATIYRIAQRMGFDKRTVAKEVAAVVRESA
jgi:hypothetical protein